MKSLPEQKMPDGCPALPPSCPQPADPCPPTGAESPPADTDPAAVSCAPPPSSDRNRLTATGYLTVSAGTAHRAYPLPGAQIEIYLSRSGIPDSGAPSSADDGMILYRRQVSGADGSAETVPIPTPEESASLSPDAPGSSHPCTLARVRVYCRGYRPQEARQVPVFPGINALQYFDLVPLAESEALSPLTDTLTVVSENVEDHL